MEGGELLSVGRIIMITMIGLLSVSACKRAPADVSGIAYQVLEEHTDGACIVCVEPSDRACSGAGRAGEVRWDLPAAMETERVKIRLMRSDGTDSELAEGSSKGKVLLGESLRTGDRIGVFEASNNRELAFIRPATELGCDLAP